jgi:DNA-binding response OmpR family regulator
MQPLLVFPDPCPAELAQALGSSGFPFVAVNDATEAEKLEPEDGWAGAVISIDAHPADALELAKTLRKRDFPLEPLLLVVGAEQVKTLDTRSDLFDDFLMAPLRHSELKARIEHQFWRTGQGTRPELVEYGELVLNLETYQAAIARRPLDMTYMEYELLKFLAQHPGKVFTRETLLNRVWGYEYYGGARTVDVHIRRLRAKLGEEHAGLIQTVRSVGYRFGQSRWSG